MLIGGVKVFGESNFFGNRLPENVSRRLKNNCFLTYDVVSSVDWDRDARGLFTEKASRDHGRVERRSIEFLIPWKRMINYSHVKQVFRVRQWRRGRY